jgi:glucans biosynthesis protein
VTVAGILVWALLTANGIVASGSEGPFGFDRLRQEAQRLAAQPYRPAGTDLPQMWRDLDYDGHRAITFRPDKALWREENLPFRVEFHHRGYLFRERIRISIVEGGTETPVPFSPDLFDYSAGEADGQGLPDDFGFAGFRLTHPINGPVDHEEFITFLGASYFRAVGRHQVYGASARGLAIGMGSRDEEFPLFTEFWIEKPAPEATAIVVYAMLDSPSVTGAYRFEIRPGRDTVVAVRAELFARKALGTVGLAPLTSMYLYGPSGPDRLRDARPQVHDSDGLLIAEASDKWTWRPLSNPRAVSLDDAPVKSLHGFGLMQRDRDPDHYRDPRTTYEKRPSIWVEVPDSGSVDSAAPWRQGTVRLLELPSDGEGQDNIGACWLPAGTIRPGQRLPVSYQLRFGPGAPQDPDLGKVAATRWSGSANGATRFEVDFDLPGSAATSPEAVVTATRGRVGPAQVHRDPSGRYWRAVFDVPSGSGQATALRVLLRIDGRPATETWSFAWPR